MGFAEQSFGAPMDHIVYDHFLYALTITVQFH